MNKNKISVCMILSGVAGSGKSTWISKWKTEHKDDSIFVINLDDLRFQMFGKYADLTHQEEKTMWTKTINDAINASGLYNYLIIDSTALKNKRRMWYYNKLKNYWNTFNLIIINRPLETCLIQNRQRDRQVPNKVIEEMYNYKEEPNDEVKKVFKIIYE
jgi:tRNA uridine 5-carbamoylmethylation protein Kti12